MFDAVNDDGYTGASVASVVARAGVSRRTFYEYFTDKNDCFLALYRYISTRLRDQVAYVLSDSPPERALQTVIRELTKHAETEPVQAQFLAGNGLAGGPLALHERERTISEISKTVKAAYAIASRRSRSPDLPAQAVIGATQWLVAQRMRRGVRNLTRLSEELIQWLTAYEQPISNHRWSILTPGPPPTFSHDVPELADAQLLSGVGKRSGRRSTERAESRRWRILVAAAERAMQTGYAATTVAAITADARIKKRDFYRHFRHKRDAFLAVHELASQESMAVGATAYFNVKQWPERVWRCLLAVSRFHAAHPAIAHVGLVETHALGLPAIQRVEDSRHAFATLLRSENQNQGPLPSVTAAEAIGAAIFEIAHDRVRHQRASELPRYAYHATYLALAPFLGVQNASRLVERKIKDSEVGAKRTSPRQRP